MRRRSCCAALGLAVMLAGCGGGGSSSNSSPPSNGGSNPPPTTNPPVIEFSVSGAVQKGPFLVGSLVLVNELTSTGKPTNSTLTTEIEDSIGSFSFGTTRRGPVQIVAQGYYFNELTGQLSAGPIALKALYEVSETSIQNAYVNIMTHLINDRVLELLSAQQISFSNAIAQAQSEFLAAFAPALPVTNVDSFSALNLYSEASGGHTGNAYLLAVSTAFYKYASLKAAQFGTSADAELTLILNVIANDLADDAQINTPGFLEEFVRAVRSLDPQVIAANLRERSVVDYPEGLDVPDISQFLSLCAGDAECDWRAGAPMPQPARSIASTAYDGKIYVFGGAGESKVLDVVRVYDPASNQWTQGAPMPIASFDVSANVIGEHIYVLAAYGPNGFMNQLMRYNPVTNTWETRANKPSHRYQFTSAVLGGRLYVIGGDGTVDDGPWESGKPWEKKDLVEIYDPPTDSWTTGTAAPMPFSGASSCVIDEQIYVFGGLLNNDNVGLMESPVTLRSFTLKFDPAIQEWTSKEPMTEAVEGAMCVATGGSAYLLGGRGSGGASNSMQRYDAELNTWASPSRLPSARYWGTAALVGSEIFLFGGLGRGDGLLTDVEIFDTSL